MQVVSAVRYAHASADALCKLIFHDVGALQDNFALRPVGQHINVNCKCERDALLCASSAYAIACMQASVDTCGYSY